MHDAAAVTEKAGLTAKGVERYLSDLSNWGRWGGDDRIGTLNLITDEVRLAAASLVRTGRAISLSRPIDPLDPDPLDSGFALVQRFMTLNEVTDHIGRQLRYEAVTEYVGIAAHGSNTHVDGLAHYSWDGKNYNGFAKGDTNSVHGARSLSMDQAEHGFITRGVLLDIAALHGVPWLERVYVTGTLWDAYEMGAPADMHAYTQAEFERRRENLPAVRDAAEWGLELLPEHA